MINQIEDSKLRDKLLGIDIEEKAQVMKWFSLVNSDLSSNIYSAYLSIKGLIPYNKKVTDGNLLEAEKIAGIFENRLREYTYLASENISCADLYAVIAFSYALSSIWGSEWRVQHPSIIRWFNTVISSPIFGERFSNFEFIQEPLKYTPPKKEKKVEQPKQSKKQETNAETPVDEVAAEPKKPKHPLELLGKSSFILDEWKRKYSNEDTRSVALPWFWEQFNSEEYSIWKVAYKYNDELTLTFMSNNLIGGFFNRLSGSIKYMFGCLVVYGENNNNGIIGAIMVRGQDFAPAFDVAPDWESYEYTKLSPSNTEDKEFINDMWAWDKPVIVNSESRDIADGKVLK